MESSRWANIGKGLLIGIGYCAAYWLLWQASFDQWFLPAGLRVTAFLLAKYKYWPYLLAGDAAALLIIRTPMSDDYGLVWSYVSPFFLGPCVNALVLGFKRKLTTTGRVAQWLPLIGICLALWGTAANIAINFALSGPPSFNTFEKALNFAIGNYLGILMIALPCFFIALRKPLAIQNKRFARDAAIASALIAAGYFFSAGKQLSEPQLHQSILMLMILPVVLLTSLHGWRGAAFGLFLVNLVIAQTMTYTGEQAVRNYDVFQVQFALSIAASALLALGTKISNLFDHARQLGISEKQALEMTRSSTLMGEQNLREHVLYMAQMQVRMDDQRKQLVELLKSQGKYTEAMMLNSAAVEHMQWFESRASAIYPIQIEELGLYGVIFPETFTDFWAGDADVLFVRATGQPAKLSIDLQLTAYRCICNAFTLLTQGAPELFRVKLHVWERKKRRGILFKIMGTPSQPLQITRSGALAEADLERRVKAYGGVIGRRQLHCVHVLLWESVESETSPTVTPHIITSEIPS